MTKSSERLTATERLRMGILLGCSVLMPLAAAWGSAGWEQVRLCWDRLITPSAAMAAGCPAQTSQPQSQSVVGDGSQ